mgnify:CR=1
ACVTRGTIGTVSVHSSTFYNNYILDTNIYLVIHFSASDASLHSHSFSLRAMTLFFLKKINNLITTSINIC